MKYCFGVDVGGTSVKMGLFSVDGKLADKWEIKTNRENGGEKILPDIAASILEKMKKKGLKSAQIEGAGLGIPAPVDAGGAVRRTANLGWGYKEVTRELGSLLGGMNVAAGNDANVAALGRCGLGPGTARKIW